jgi:cholesterol transport system auxiliary component
MSRNAQLRPAFAMLVAVGMLAACAGIAPPAVDEVSTYVLDARPVVGRLPARPDTIISVGTPHAWPGFDTPRMAYVKQPHELEYFVKSRWVDAPARMLAPLLARTLEQSGAFGAVMRAPGAVAGTVRLDTELVRLQQEFVESQSRVRVTLRVQLVDVRERRVIGAREFEEIEEVAADNAYAGVVAMNRALERVLPRIAEFCADPLALK